MVEIFCCPTKFCRFSTGNNNSNNSNGGSNSSSHSNNLNVIVIPALLSVCGIAALEYGGLEPPSLIDVVVLIAPICFAMGFWRTEYLASQYPQETSVITGSLLWTTTTICFLYSLLSQEFPLTIYDLKIAYSSIFLDWRVIGGLLYAGST